MTRLVIEVAEIEINTACPRRCSYCPNSIPELRQTDHHMPDALYERVISELCAADYVGRLSFHLYSEPLLRRDLARLVSIARSALPRTFLVLFTNGDLLTDRRHAELVEAGVDRFFVTRHDDRPMPSRKYQIVQHWTEMTLTSRGGVVATGPTLHRACHAPAEMLIITVTADVLLCHEDGRREHVMGNLGRQSLREVWLSPEFVRKREVLRGGDRAAAGGLCRHCDHSGYAIPGMTM
jgi:MoaA/NifB/PqqE/SkfB family radical SAM enzyme